MKFSEIKGEVSSALRDTDRLGDIAVLSGKIAGITGFATVGNAVQDLRENGKLAWPTKAGLAFAAGAAAVGTAAAIKSADILS